MAAAASSAPAADYRQRAPADVRVLVVGATGYIGKFVVKELVQRGYNVVAFARERSGIGGKQSAEDVRAEFPGAGAALLALWVLGWRGWRLLSGFTWWSCARCCHSRLKSRLLWTVAKERQLPVLPARHSCSRCRPRLRSTAQDHTPPACAAPPQKCALAT